MEYTQNILNPLILSNSLKQLSKDLVYGSNNQQLLRLVKNHRNINHSTYSLDTIQTVPVNGININTGTKTLHDISILFGSRTGNGTSIAKKLKELSESGGFKVNLYDMNTYAFDKLQNETYLFVIVSTHGEGKPPIAAEGFYDFIHDKNAPRLDNMNFSVLALGDKSYLHFCKTGIDVDNRLEELGAKRFFKRIDCDVNFVPKATEWINGILEVLYRINNIKTGVTINETAKTIPSESGFYNRTTPYKARLLNKTKLNGQGSTKETFHYELSIEGSGITYEPGDAIGVFGSNSERLVYEMIDAFKLNPGEEIEFDGKKQSLGNILTKHFEISTLNPESLKKFNDFAQSAKLKSISENIENLETFIYGRDWVDIANEFPVKLKSFDLLSLLRPLQPRLYSLSSSLKANPGEAHITVVALRYINDRYKEGACSTYLCDRLGNKDALLIFPEKNPEFRLPSDPNTSVIMVGPGTGIAPFRAFLQERKTIGAKGKNWLFFGDRHFTTDFLYKDEILAWHEQKILTNLDIAFSRDTDKKQYVQYKMAENSKELFKWLEEGAHFYVCGDMKNMWTDVNRTLIKIIAKETGISFEKAEEYVKMLKKNKRYQVDVY